ncbi:MAG: thioredoxin family protein [Flavobacterium sp. MedPE-SWcel]|uniref:bacillithiol system redox-active protein YtxJ n=1 Tax=uncultured Flavobacterium sp. TaxID=165435 RepID=UPI0009227B9D|nr:bacillithiol system redox-active protein YtxJ [uncultured Flavobacterium sp.]OIQ16881.1 MAG: thioredoxin family protein [Flavobacterium sp. MedPE-SWcel]
MSFLNKIFGSNDNKTIPTTTLKWNELTQIQQLDTIVNESSETPVLIFKHSTRCSISRMALRSFEQEYEIAEDDLKPYYLNLLEYRNISNEIASRFGVMHQSPQILLIKNGKVLHYASHSDIDARTVQSKI